MSNKMILSLRRMLWYQLLQTDLGTWTKQSEEDWRKEYVSQLQINLTDIPLPTDKGREELFKINLKGLPLEEDIDWNHLIKVTEGYSGADITNVCRDAAMMPMRKKLEKGAFDLNNIQNLQDEIDIPLTMQDFKDAIKNIQKSVSQEQLTSYAEWMKMFGSV